ncbi:hypothetical protein SAMN05421770_101412 [Granulicella rosea]|uniref:DUF3592 domain-containing protein n=1 Tax=Granulicella rosea TaxID=474952 RepID=A0A239DER8_9BACT|nr:hypothetical protein [Granulicella rosea]SNS30324.1 hypothetical protein SAMN05421770_101412 [Granulicella rosea]
MANPIANLLKDFKQKRRLSRARSLPAMQARILHAEAKQVQAKDELAFEIALSYRFEADGQAAYGSAFSVWFPVENYAKSLAAQVTPEAKLKVRYNPKDPFENYALASDNPGVLPFQLAE